MGQGQISADDFASRPRSGQASGVTSGTVVGFPDVSCTSIIITPHPSNSGVVWIGNSTGTVSGNTGYPLKTDRPPIIFSGVSNLNYLKASFDVPNDKICWIVETIE